MYLRTYGRATEKIARILFLGLVVPPLEELATIVLLPCGYN